MIFRPAKTMDDLIKVFIVRAIVFIGEQHCPYGEEIDEFEPISLHFLGEIEGEPIAAARLRFPGNYAKLERIAVRREWRGRGYGHALVDYLIDQAEQRGYKTLKMHAQAHLVDFYARHGFVRQGEIFQEAGIDHYLMVRIRDAD
ncbi:MAG: GNAT family N-acetyltransferase [candidate division KSB1 bacterium]|nr:GNAT family N-acetyltransferase [candidate division KSB1 bacterium]